MKRAFELFTEDIEEFLNGKLHFFAQCVFCANEDASNLIYMGIQMFLLKL